MTAMPSVRLRVLPALIPINGKNVELQSTASYIQWRNVGDAAWQNLIALSAITGPQGPGGLIQAITPGSNISVNNSNPANPIVSTPSDMVSTNNGNDFASKPDVRKNISVSVQVADRTALKALDTTKDTLANLQSSGREGFFAWVAGDFSAQITADTQEGMYVKANAVASTAGAWVRILDGDINVLHFGARGDCTGFGAGTDDKTAIQIAWNIARLLKRNLYFPARKYRLTGILSMPTASGDTFLPSLLGASDGGSILMWDAAVTNGIQMFGNGATAFYFEIKNLAFLSTGLTGLGFNLLKSAWFKMENCRLEGWDSGFLGTDILSCTFANNYFRGNKQGFEAAIVSASDPNAITFVGNNFGGNIHYGCKLTGATTVKFVGGAFEGNGVNGSLSDRCGLWLSECGGAGNMGVDIDTVYFEYNSIVADIVITNTTKQCVYNIHGCTFARYWDGGGVVQYGVNCIQLVGGSTFTQQLNYCDNGFSSVASYVPNAGRPYVAVTGSACRVYERGNLYEDAIERPSFSVPYNGPGGDVSAWALVTSGGALTSGYNVASVTKLGAGQYRITWKFALTTASYYAPAQPINNTGYAITTAQTTTTADINVYNTAWTLTDGPFQVSATGGSNW